MNLGNVVRILITGVTVLFGIYFIMDFMKHKDSHSKTGWGKLLIVGVITDFFDTLGIGSFAPTQALYKFGKMVEDRVVPGTLNVGHTIPVVTEAVLFIGAVEVEPITLVCMLGAAALGSFIGAGLVSKLPAEKVRLAMGAALFVVGGVMLMQQLKIMPAGGEAIGLSGIKLVIGVVCNFILGALMTIGVGLYAPCMALVAILGMNVSAAFPIMMGSCAYLMPVCGYKFIKEGAYDRKAAMGLTVGGIVGVFIAVYIVTSLPLYWLKWLVIGVIFYTAITYLKDAKKK